MIPQDGVDPEPTLEPTERVRQPCNAGRVVHQVTRDHHRRPAPLIGAVDCQIENGRVSWPVMCRSVTWAIRKRSS